MFITFYFCVLLYMYSFLDSSVRGITCGMLGVFIILYYFFFTWKGNKGNWLTMFLRFTWYVIIILTFYNNYEIKSGHYGREVYFIVPVLFFLMCSDNINWIYILIKCTKFFTSCSIIATFLVEIVPSIYSDIIVNFFPLWNESTAELNDTINRSYNAGISVTAGINSAYLAMGVAVHLYGYLEAHNSRDKINSSMWLVLGIIALFITDKRGSILFSLCSIIVVLYFNLSQRTKTITLMFIFFIITIIILGTIGIIDSNTISRYWNEESSSGRTLLYSVALRLFSYKPVLGNGWMSYQYLSGIKSRGAYMMTHNVYLQLLCEVGVVGFLIVIAGFILNGVVLLKVIKKTKLEGRYEYYLGLLGLFGESFFLLTCLTGNSLYDNVFFYFYAFSCAIELSIYKKVCINCYE